MVREPDHQSHGKHDRGALSGLTLRGRSFAAAGLAAGSAALLLGQRDLLRVAVLLVALPLAGVWAVNRMRYRIVTSRTVSPLRVPAGQDVAVTLDLRSLSRLPTGVVLVEDQVPPALGARPRFVVNRLSPQEPCQVHYRLRPLLRGHYPLGPLSIRLADPFGMCELNRTAVDHDVLVVAPAAVDLPTVALPGSWGGYGQSRSRAAAAAGEDDVATREYHRGDELRRVHWRATAKVGSLMVRREEQPWQARATVLLDTRTRAHRGEGAQASLEWAVAAAASIALHLFRRGFTVRLVAGQRHGAVLDRVSTGPDFVGTVLDTLAGVGPGDDHALTAAAEKVRGSSPGLVVAVLGILALPDAEELSRLLGAGTGGVGVLLDAASWSRPSPVHPVPGQLPAAPNGSGLAAAGRAGASGVLLAQHGWRVLPVVAGDDLPSLWSEVAGSAP